MSTSKGFYLFWLMVIILLAGHTALDIHLIPQLTNDQILFGFIPFVLIRSTCMILSVVIFETIYSEVLTKELQDGVNRN